MCFLNKMFVNICSSLQVIVFLTFNFHKTLSITIFRRHFNGLSDWEVGLREATYHALIRERRIRHPHLKEYLYSAPLLGRQDTATPFGDIAIVARGQLYSAPGGFQFVQDPYQNDCDGCHNTPLRCESNPCEYWSPHDHERLLALWTIKRIRHRDSQYGFKYDFEYKISPISSIRGEPFIKRNGNFDYSIWGHKFIVQKDPNRFHFEEQGPYEHRHHSLSYPTSQWPVHFEEPNDNEYPPPLLPPFIEDYPSEDYHNAAYGPNPDIDLPESFYSSTSTEHSTTHNNNWHNDASELNTNHMSLSTIRTTDEAEFLFPKQKPTNQTKIPFLPTVLTIFTKPPSTSPTYLNENTQTVHYSEPDPLFSNTMSTKPTTKVFSPITNYPTTPTSLSTNQSDYSMELFGKHPFAPTTANKISPQSTSTYMLLGEQAITLVSPPTIRDEQAINSTVTFETTTIQAITSPKNVDTTSVKPKQFLETKKIDYPNNVITTSVTSAITIMNTTLSSIYLPEQENTTITKTTTPNYELTSNEITTTKIIFTNVSTNIPSTTNAAVTDNSEFVTSPSTENRRTTDTYYSTTDSTTTIIPNVVSTIKTQKTSHSTIDTSTLDDELFQETIFGRSNKKLTTAVNPHHSTVISPSDLDDIFGYPTTLADIDNYDIEENEPKIIFSNFFLPTSAAITYETTTTRTTNKDNYEENEDVQNRTNNPVTSQSYITSVSFEINKKNKTQSMDSDKTKFISTKNVKMKAVPLPYSQKKLQFDVHTQRSNVFDTLTTSVLNHAKSIKYLNEDQMELQQTVVPKLKRQVAKRLKNSVKS